MLSMQRRILCTASKRLFNINHSKYGYIVLVPEIGEDGAMGDISMQIDGLPAFNEITIENCLGAIGRQAGAAEKVVKRIESQINEKPNDIKLSLRSIFQQLDEVSGPLDTTWGIAKALYLGNSTLIPTKTYMNIHERARIAKAAKFCSQTLYMELQKYDQNYVTGDEKRLLQKYLLEGKLNGLSLDKKKQDIMKDLLIQTNKERTTFKNKVNLAIHSFAHIIKDFQLVRDFPISILEATKIDTSNSAMQGPWKFSLQPQIVENFLKYCPDRDHRWNIWQANVRKASIHVDKSLETSTHIEKIRDLRKRQANLLGYPNYATMSMQTKMVKDISKLKEIFAKILQFAGPAQHVEIEQLQKFATDNGFEHKLELWDVSYWQRKYLLSKYQLNEETIKDYFPLPRVISGLFALCESLFQINIVQRKDAQVWQQDVKYYDVYHNKTGSKPIGGFYVDCYAKENKFSKNNGWMIGIRNRNVAAQLSPLCALIFNFNASPADKPYLLSIDDLCLVFKTFGSALQHMLTEISYSELAGLSNVEWDASQITGYVMVNFLDNPINLKNISGHYETDAPLSDELANKIPMFKTYLAGYKTCEELYYADLDIELHQSESFWLDIVRKLWPIYRHMPLQKRDSHPCSLTEIFSGDWAAAQFSHLYSKIIAADISAIFEENCNNMTETGKRFKNTFLTAGGSLPTKEIFHNFSGRDPSVEAFLRPLNILNASTKMDNL